MILLPVIFKRLYNLPDAAKKFKITLVAPPVNFHKDIYGFKGKKSYRSQPPLGIGYLGSVLLKAGFQLSLIDCAAHGWDNKRSAKQIMDTKPDLVGITSITFEAPAAFSLTRKLKKDNSNPFVVLGGAHANSFYDKIPNQCPELDAIAVGESEVTMVELCENLSHGLSPKGVSGLRYKTKDGAFSDFEERPPVEDLDSLPFPAYDLYKFPLYKPLPHRAKRSPSWCMIKSRGCSYGLCTYCEMSKLVRRHFRCHSPARVVREMEYLSVEHGVRDIYFQDDIFINDSMWVEEFCRKLVKSGLDIIWSCESRFLGASKELLGQMKNAGCWRIYYGFEAGSQRLLDNIKKGFTLEQAKEGAAMANEAGMDVVGFFMLGLPGETPQDALKTISFSKSLGLDHAMYALTLPHPDTELYSICEKVGTIIKGGEYHYKKASYIPRAYKSAKQLEDLRGKAFRSFYLRPSYIWRCLKKIRTLEDFRYYLRGFLALFSYLD